MTSRHLCAILVVGSGVWIGLQLEAFAQTPDAAPSSINVTAIVVALINLLLPIVAAFATYLINKTSIWQRS